MTTPTDKLAELVFGTEAPKDDATKASWHAAVDAVFAEKAAEDYTFQSLTAGEVSAIVIHPVTDDEGVFLGWELYVPPTTEDAFDFEFPENFEPNENPTKGVHGETVWDTLLGAVSSLSIAVKQGQIKFNDGRVVQ